MMKLVKYALSLSLFVFLNVIVAGSDDLAFDDHDCEEITSLHESVMVGGSKLKVELPKGNQRPSTLVIRALGLQRLTFHDEKTPIVCDKVFKQGTYPPDETVFLKNKKGIKLHALKYSQESYCPEVQVRRYSEDFLDYRIELFPGSSVDLKPKFKLGVQGMTPYIMVTYGKLVIAAEGREGETLRWGIDQTIHGFVDPYTGCSQEDGMLDSYFLKKS